MNVYDCYIDSIPTKMGKPEGWATIDYHQLINENGLNQACKKLLINSLQLFNVPIFHNT